MVLNAGLMDTVMSHILLQLLLLHTETWCAALRHIDDTCRKRRAGVCKVCKGQVPCITGMRLEQCSAPLRTTRLQLCLLLIAFPACPIYFPSGTRPSAISRTHTQLSVVLPYARLETFYKIKVNVGQRHNRGVEKNKGKRDDGKGISTFFFQFFIKKRAPTAVFVTRLFICE